jgi:hypothetical protein
MTWAEAGTLLRDQDNIHLEFGPRSQPLVPAPDTLTRRRERIAGIHRLSIDTIELYERNMIDELAHRLVHGDLPVGS